MFTGLAFHAGQNVFDVLLDEAWFSAFSVVRMYCHRSSNQRWSRGQCIAPDGARRGLVLLYVLFAMTVFVILASLAVDMGHVRVAKVQLQFAADSAARAACEDLPNGVTAAQNAAVTWAGKNTVDGTPVSINATTDVVFGIWDPIAKTFTIQSGFMQSHSNAVQVVASRALQRQSDHPFLRALLGEQFH
jgi:hypothetical protein